VLRLITSGYANGQIAALLRITETVKIHVKNIIEQMGQTIEPMASPSPRSAESWNRGHSKE